jgi:hypothetical protein
VREENSNRKGPKYGEEQEESRLPIFSFFAVFFLFRLLFSSCPCSSLPVQLF